jgi:hypothetical protein
MSETIQDSGHRTEFGTGAVRDARPGVGRCDLLPLDVTSEWIGYEPLRHIESYIWGGDATCLYNALTAFAEQESKDKPTMLLEVSQHYEAGAEKYSARNWQMGINLHCYIDSAVRHYLKHIRGDTDECHDRAFVWNLLGAIWTQKHKPEMIDLPFKDKPAESCPCADCEHETLGCIHDMHDCAAARAEMNKCESCDDVSIECMHGCAKPQYREVIREAKEKEWVKIINADSPSNEYKNGDILQVNRMIDGDSRIVQIRTKRGFAPVYRREYVVLEGYQPCLS